MKIFLSLICFFVLTASSYPQAAGHGDPVVEPAKVLGNIQSWLIYNRDYLKLSGNFIALDPASNTISKELFLKSLSSGKYLPLRLTSKNSNSYYKLYKLPASVDNDVLSTIKDLGEVEYEHFKMEGKELPGYNFVDLNGKAYNKKAVLGKILVLKCWFIRCQQCVEEMPALNKLVAKYKDRKDILFVSLAFDSKKDLQTFLTKRNFNYEVVPDQQNYIINDLKINIFPTHLIINKQGKIAKVVGSADELIAALDNEALK